MREVRAGESYAGLAVPARCCNHPMAFSPFPGELLGQNRDPFAPKHHRFVALLLHNLMPFTTKPGAEQSSSVR